MLPALHAARAALDSLLADEPTLARVAAVPAVLAAALREGHKILLCGNGGSACDAAHFAEELTGRFNADRPPLAAIACADPGHLTCTANDYGFEHVFSRWVEALARPGDVLILLSTSGDSENVVRAAGAASARSVATVALLGKGGGRLRGRCTHEVIVPGAASDRVQELHMLILHAWAGEVERLLFPPAR